MRNKIIFKYDSRDKEAFRKFGQLTSIDLKRPINFDDPLIVEKIQPNGDIKCVLFTATYLAQNRTKKEYDIDELWERVPHYSGGTDIREVFGEVIKNGLKVKGTNIYEKPFISYWKADTGAMDAFDNTRSASALAESPIAIASFWYIEWMGLPNGAVMPVGKTPVNGHMYSGQGWNFANVNGEVDINGEPMLIIEFWGGKTYLMPRNTFNEAMKPWGMGSWVLSTLDIDEKRNKTYLEIIKDLCINVIIKLRDLIKLREASQPVVESQVIEPEPKVVYEEVKESLMKYDWSTQEKARHSVRVICDEEGLTVKDKNDLCATVGGESGWKINIVGKPNSDGSMDFGSIKFGIAQINNKYWIGDGKTFPSTEYVLSNPEACIRWMCRNWKKNKNWWYAFKNGSYKKYLNPKFDKNGDLL